MDVSWEGVVYLYMAGFWPLAAASLVYAFRRNTMSNKSRYWNLSSSGGYVAVILVPFSYGLLTSLIEVAGIWKASRLMPEPKYVLAYVFVAPLVCSHFAAKKCSP